MNIYQIGQEYKVILDAVMQGDGEITIEQVESLARIEGMIDDKAIAIASYIKNLEAESQAITSAWQAMKYRADRLAMKADFLTDHLHNQLKYTGINEITKSPYFAIKIKKCPPSVEVIDESILDKKYIVSKQIVAIDKGLIKEDLKNGLEVTGAELVQNTRLEIK